MSRLSFLKKITNFVSHIFFRSKKKKGKRSDRYIPKWKQIKYIKKILTPRELVIVRICTALIVLSIIWIVGYGWLYGLKDVPRQGGSYTEGLIGQPVHINPLYASTNDVDRTLTKLVFASLVRFDTNFELVGDLAKEWQISEDEKEYTFYLRDDITWPDGVPFTAEDVLFTIQSVQDPEYLSPLRGEWQGIEVIKIDDYTIQFKLPEAFAPFIANATIGIIPAHLWQTTPPLNAPLAELNVKPIGLGPWSFKTLTKDKQGVIRSYTIERNENYHGTKPWLDELQFKLYPSFEAALISLRDRNVDGIGYVPLERRDALKVRKDLKFYPLQLPQYTAVFFNKSKNETLKSLNVRKALAHAIDRNSILDAVLSGEGRIVNGPILEGYPGYNPLIKQYEFDPLKSAELLDGAGWKLNSDTKKRQDGDDVFRIRLTTVNQPDYVKTAEMISEQWKTLGLEVELVIVSGDTIEKSIIKPRDYEALLFGEILGFDPDPYPFWHSTQANENGLNLANFASRKVDNLIEEARSISDPEKRGDLYKQFQDVIVENAPSIFLYSPNLIYPVSERVNGITLKRVIEPSDRFENVHEWYIKTKKSIRK